RPVLEWVCWVGLALLAYSQTGYFDQTIPEYRYGATGWPRAICFLLIIGASAQLAFRSREIIRGQAEQQEWEAEQRKPIARMRLAQCIAVFVLPLVYLYLVPSVGFYVATPVFIVLLMLLLEVRSIKALAGVTAVVFGTFLIVFTRFFYVALPVGNVQP